MATDADREPVYLDSVKKARMLEVCGFIRSDIDRDLVALRGVQFTPAALGTHLGYVAAQLEALTNLIEECIKLH